MPLRVPALIPNPDKRASPASRFLRDSHSKKAPEGAFFAVDGNRQVYQERTFTTLAVKLAMLRS
jgi:hypothetical protein